MLVNFAVVGFVIAHVYACVWFALGHVEYSEGSGLNRTSWLAINAGTVDPDSWIDTYVTALYWSLATMSTIGYGDIHAVNVFERVFSVFVMITGTAVYAYGITSIFQVLSGPASTGLSHTSAAAITKAYDALVSSIRSLKQLPLAIRAVHATSAVLADLTPFPPTRVPTGAPPPAGAVELSFTIQFESSGKWPADQDAVAALQTAFCLRIADAREEQTEALCEVHSDRLLIQMAGYAFTATNHHEPTVKLLRAVGRLPEARVAHWMMTAAHTHVAALSALGRRFPAFPPGARLVKRWASSQLLHASESVLEMLVAATTPLPSPRPQKEGACRGSRPYWARRSTTR